MTDRSHIIEVARDAELNGEFEQAAKLRAELGQLSPIEQIIGKTMKRVELRATDLGEGEEVIFEAITGEKWRMYYSQDCCAYCFIEDIIGDLDDLIGFPILMADESMNSSEPRISQAYVDESFTWTFYKFATINGYVTIRWYGTSNGYYSERARFERSNEPLNIIFEDNH